MEHKPYNPSTFLGGHDTILRIQRKYAARFAPGARVLDLGCGEGLFLDLLRQRGAHGLGVDSYPPAVEACRRKGLDVRQADLFHYLRRCRQKFDGVFCSHIVEHLAPGQTERLLLEANRVLKDRGLLIILTPNSRDIDVMTERFWLDTTHVRPYPLKLLRAMLEHMGFEVVAGGLDRDSRRRWPKRRPTETFEFLIQKLRWGKFFGSGDTYIIGRKMADLKGTRQSPKR